MNCNRHVSRSVRFAFAIFAIVTLVVLSGVALGLFTQNLRRGYQFSAGLRHADVGHYVDIMQNGYQYDASGRSTVAFFPVFPLLGRLVWKATGVAPELALLFVALAATLLSYVIAPSYFRSGPMLKYSDADNTTYYGMLLFAFTPCNLFRHLPLSESVFVLLVLFFLIGLQRNHHSLWLAMICGVATAVRPVGVALVPPLVVYVLTTSNRLKWLRLAMYLPVAMSGLLVFVAFQQQTFGDGLAFVKTQQHWHVRSRTSPLDELVLLAAGEPIVRNYTAGTLNWKNRNRAPVLFNLQFANPIYFLMFGAVILVGWSLGILTKCETLLAVALWAIPYLTRGYLWGMGSHGRFMIVIIPVYRVIAVLCSEMPRTWFHGAILVSAILMFSYSVLFGAGLPIF